VTNTTTINATAPSASRVVTIPDPGANASFVMTAGTQTISGTKTFDGQLIGKGTTTNDSAAAGYIGEFIEATSTSNVDAASTGTYDDLVSIPLTAGDWDIAATIQCTRGVATWSEMFLGISTTSGNSSAGLTAGVTVLQNQWASSSTTPVTIGPTLPMVRASLSGSTTYYLKREFGFSAGTPRSNGGRLTARRIR
jgi:hypothetical protein